MQDNSCMKTVYLFIYLFVPVFSFSQDIASQLAMQVKNLEKDEQFKHAIISLYVVDSKTGKVVFDKNGNTGLVPASCQKIVTSVSAFELLGPKYCFKTYVLHDQQIKNGMLEGNLYFTGQGDPTLGSERWKTTTEEAAVKKITGILQKNKIQSIAGDLVVDDSYFAFEPIPNGWVWEDIGNYYGAGVWGLNWRENQYDVTFKSGKAVNDSTEIIASRPSWVLKDYSFINFVKTAAKGTGDNAWLFSAPLTKNIIARGTVPMSAEGFTITGSIPDPPKLFLQTVERHFKNSGITVSGNTWSYSERLMKHKPGAMQTVLLDSIVSPSLDSINYWFLKKSVNIFGEDFVKTIARKKNEDGSTGNGVNVIKDFWSNRGIEKAALNIIDGSGLSPANRITTIALVTILQYAEKQNWYPLFYNALPVMNGITMKDGYINGVRSYAGYIKSKNGAAYTFSFIVNNFDGSPATVREKMWKVLDLLK
jgi:D-alanyl-D-alanine carboxypeptidase/D-alanyl-D-alanine-endopeptidase (penicillin-binding protein 4)